MKLIASVLEKNGILGGRKTNHEIISSDRKAPLHPMTIVWFVHSINWRSIRINTVGQSGSYFGFSFTRPWGKLWDLSLSKNRMRQKKNHFHWSIPFLRRHAPAKVLPEKKWFIPKFWNPKSTIFYVPIEDSWYFSSITDHSCMEIG